MLPGHLGDYSVFLRRRGAYVQYICGDACKVAGSVGYSDMIYEQLC